VLLAGTEPQQRPNLCDRSALALGPAATRRADESLTHRIAMPPRPRLEGYPGTANECRLGWLKKWINPQRACEPRGRTRDRRLRGNSVDFHFSYSSLFSCSVAWPLVSVGVTLTVAERAGALIIDRRYRLPWYFAR
jgi:hypothetical protein